MEEIQYKHFVASRPNTTPLFVKMPFQDDGKAFMTKIVINSKKLFVRDPQ